MTSTISRLCRPLVLAGVLCAAVLSSEAQACPNCRESLPNGQQAAGAPAQPQVAQGYAWSIYLMIAVPFAMVATMSGAAVVLMRRASVK